MFSCKFFKIFNNTYFTEKTTLPNYNSDNDNIKNTMYINNNNNNDNSKKIKILIIIIITITFIKLINNVGGKENGIFTW